MFRINNVPSNLLGASTEENQPKKIKPLKNYKRLKKRA